MSSKKKPKSTIKKVRNKWRKKGMTNTNIGIAIHRLLNDKKQKNERRIR